MRIWLVLLLLQHCAYDCDENARRLCASRYLYALYISIFVHSMYISIMCVYLLTRNDEARARTTLSCARMLSCVCALLFLLLHLVWVRYMRARARARATAANEPHAHPAAAHDVLAVGLQHKHARTQTYASALETTTRPSRPKCVVR